MKIPFFRSVFTKMIFALSVSFLIIISISFLYIYGSVRDSMKEKTDSEKIQNFNQPVSYTHLDVYKRQV